jgi:hypothetical protein
MAEPTFEKIEEKKSVADRIFRFEFAKQTKPEFVAQKNKDWVLYGEDNDYLKYLIELFDGNAEHNSIVTAKSNYIAGKGLFYDKSKVEDPKAQARLDQFLSYANQFQTWDDLLPKISLDLELFNGYALQIVFGAGGKPEETYHIQFNRIRLSKCGKRAFYCEDWECYKPDAHPSFKEFPLYNPTSKKGTVILYYKIYRPTAKRYGDVYPVPDYIGCTADIETDINITAFHYSNTENGFSAPGMINFYNGEPTEEDKKKIAKKFQKKHTGPNNAGTPIFNFINEDQKGAEFIEFANDRLDKMFEVLAKRIQQKIFTGHKVTNPVLFGIKTEGQLGNRNELIESYEHFQKTYIDLRRPHVLNTIKLIAERKGVMWDVLDIENAEPIGVDIPVSEQEISDILSFDEKRNLISEKYGIKLTSVDEDKDKRISIAKKLGPGAMQSLLELIKDPSIAPERKIQMINGLYNIPIKKAQAWLGFTEQTIQPSVGQQKMSKQDPVLELLLSEGVVYDGDDEVLEEKFIDFDSPEAALKFESEQFHKFKYVAEIKTVRDKILEILSGAGETKPDVIAKQLGLDAEYVLEQIDYLIDKKLLTEAETGFTVTTKGINKAEDLDPVVETEVYTMYKYSVRDGVPPAKKSREFCQKLMASGKEYTREQIESISGRTGENVWIYRGGFYTNPDTEETTPYCRHIWKAITRTRRKK